MSIVKEYIDFQSNSVSPFHVLEFVQKFLLSHGFTMLSLCDDKWLLKQGSSYIVCHPDGKAAVCFSLGAKSPSRTGYSIVGSHVDSPAFRLKSKPFYKKDKTLCLLPQVHGSMIYRSWLDRPLELAGRVYSLKKNKNTVLFSKDSCIPQVDVKLVRSNSAAALIPDVAIHLDPKKNLEGEINPEEFLKIAVSSNAEEDISLHNFFKKTFKVSGNVDGFEIYCAPVWPHLVVGIDNSYILGPRHDDLAMVFTSVKALASCAKQKRNKTSVVCLLDAEETGSQTCSGAGSSFVRDVLTRIDSDYPEASVYHSHPSVSLSKSLFISADMAHAAHPGKSSKHDINHRPVINKGIVIKENANDRYASSGYTSTIVKAYCQIAKVPYQEYVCRQDMGCGSTIGPILSASLGCKAADIGLSMWSMHSSAETMGTKDLSYAVDFFSSVFLSE
jgi:aspartyl aminopeptidase